MARTKLLDGNLSREERIIAEYIDEEASDALVEKINTGKKGIKDCWSFIFKQAKAKAKGGSSIAITHEEVFGWAMHYFEEDSIEKGKTDNHVKAVISEKPKAAVPKTIKKEEPKKKEDMLPGQMTIFDLMGGTQ